MLENLPDVIGHALRNQRAGADKMLFNLLDLRTGMAAIEVRSLAFADHAPIPARYTADGEGLSPPLQWIGVPTPAVSVVLVVEDIDAPTPSPLVHAIVVGLAPRDEALAEGALASADHEGAGLHTGRNSLLQAAWLPPDPPPGHGVHRYVFQVFALNREVEFADTPGRDEVLDALREHAIASGMLTGTFERPDGSEKVGADAPAPAVPFIGGALA